MTNAPYLCVMSRRMYQVFSFPASSGFSSRQQTILKALHWAESFSCFHFFTGNQTTSDYPHGGFPTLLAVGARHTFPVQDTPVFAGLQDFVQTNRDWVIGYLGYDLKNEIETLTSQNPDHSQFPNAGFYVPEHIIFFREDALEIASFAEPESIWDAILQTELPEPQPPVFSGMIQPRTTRETYLQTVRRLQEHILDGDIYEVNYCMELFAENAALQPLEAYLALNALSPMPFSVFGKMDRQYLLCASPERFLKKAGNHLISMPIKGTVRRGFSPEEDTILKQQLHASEKERAENMMIVDLVRNDLARSAVPGTVKVEEMFGIYTFAALHQMISTVSAEIRPGVSTLETIRNAFPMGSMTGAPKIMAMQLIDRYENNKRSLYSGAAGYFTPDGDFDFNVVIRSILYNAATQYLSFSVGSAITYDSIPEQEYEECLLKAQSLYKVLMGS
jgi:para-aminobenzoate synthetase component 1